MDRAQATARTTDSNADDLRENSFPGRGLLAALMTMAAFVPLVLGKEAVALPGGLDEAPPDAADETSLVVDTQKLVSPQAADGVAITLSDGRVFAVEDSIVTDSVSGPEQVGGHETDGEIHLPSAGEIAMKGGALALGVMGAVGAIRGSVKAAHYLGTRITDREQFVGRECMQTPSCNFHMVEEVNGRHFLKIRSIDKPELDDIFRNGYADRVFKGALSHCSAEQPFPSLNLDAKNRPLIEDKVALLYGRTKDSPTLILEEINKLLRDSYSALYREGAVAHSMGLETRQDTHVLIPVCEVSAEGGRDLIFVAISETDFQKFADESSELRVTPPEKRLGIRITHLIKAFQQQEKFREQTGVELFPRIDVFIKV